MSDEKYKQEARHSWQEIASIAESVPESASYIHGFIDGIKIGNKELERKLELAIEVLKKIQWEEKLGLLINGEKIATQVLEQLK